jgi:hypothetical protein
MPDTRRDPMESHPSGPEVSSPSSTTTSIPRSRGLVLRLERERLADAFMRLNGCTCWRCDPERWAGKLAGAIS